MINLRQRQSSINKLHEEAFDTIRKQHATKKLLRLPKSDIKVMTEMPKTVRIQLNRVTTE